MTHRLTSLRLVIAAVILVDALALGAHEVSMHSQLCSWAVWRVPQCQVVR
jgi:hypothetical protein